MLLITSNGFVVTADTKAANQEINISSAVAETFTLISENDKLALYVDINNANIAVLEKTTQTVWKAFRDDLTSSSTSSSVSLLDITYSGENNLIMKTGTNSDAAFEIRKLKNGCKFIFYLETKEASFTIPFKILLHKDYLEIILLYDEIKENGEGQIADITLLPNWGAGTAEEEGYVFIPDGSGAIIEYSDAALRNETYSAKIYGEDPSQDLIYPKISDNETVRLPVFGIRHKNCAELSIIAKGDASATINAAMVNDIVTCNASFVYRESDLTGIQQSDGATRTMTILQSKHLDTNPTVYKFFLTDDEANYSGMARKYREYVIEEYDLDEKVKKVTSAVTIEAFGAVLEEKSFLGIPYKSVLTATTFSQLKEFAKKLKEEDISNSQFFLYGFLNGGYEGSTNVSMKYLNKLGGNSGYKEFVKVADTENVYTVCDIQRSFGRSFDFFRSTDYMKSLNQTVVEKHYYSLASEKWNTDFGLWKFYTVDKQKKLFTKLLKNLSKDTNVVLAHTGAEIPSDFTVKETVSREDYLIFLNQMFKKCESKNINTAFETGNAYTVKYASSLYEIPLCSSGFSIESYDVPFYTMVFHGLLPISSTAVNEQEDKKIFMLKAFEQGVSATWRVTGENPNKLKKTKLNFLYNSQTDYVLEYASILAKDYNTVHAILYDKQIIDHSYYGDLSITTYENGWKLVCNYGDSEAVYQDKVIDVTDYALIQ